MGCFSLLICVFCVVVIIVRVSVALVLFVLFNMCSNTNLLKKLSTIWTSQNTQYSFLREMADKIDSWEMDVQREQGVVQEPWCDQRRRHQNRIQTNEQSIALSTCWFVIRRELCRICVMKRDSTRIEFSTTFLDLRRRRTKPINEEWTHSSNLWNPRLHQRKRYVSYDQ